MYPLNSLIKWNSLFPLLGCLLLLIKTADAVQCWECNVWKAGYGHLCDNPLLRDDCLLCMKTETTVFMGYYKDTPRHSTIISRICSKSKTVSFGDECHYYDMSDGVSVKCYCNGDQCNGAEPSRSMTSSLITALLTASVLVTRWLS